MYVCMSISLQILTAANGCSSQATGQTAGVCNVCPSALCGCHYYFSSLQSIPRCEDLSPVSAQDLAMPARKTIDLWDIMCVVFHPRSSAYEMQLISFCVITIIITSCPDWRRSPHADRRHCQRWPVCHTWLTTVQCIIDFSLFGLVG